MDNPGTYIAVLVIGIVLTTIVGQLLIRAGRKFLEDVFEDRDTAASVSKLLAVLFYLVVLGVLALLSIVDVPTEGVAQTVIAKLGVVLLVLGVAHGATMYALARIRRRRREQDVATELHQQVERARVHHHHHDDSEDTSGGQPPPVSGGPSIR